MNRRGFLAALTGAVLDPERLLWRPGAKLISIPKPPPLVLRKGETFTIDMAYMVNPITRRQAIYTDPKTGQRYRFRRQFVVTADVASGEIEIKANSFPPLITEGMYRNTVLVSAGGRVIPGHSSVERISGGGNSSIA